MNNLFTILLVISCIGIWFFIKKSPNKKRRNIAIVLAVVSFFGFGVTQNSDSKTTSTESHSTKENHSTKVESKSKKVKKEKKNEKKDIMDDYLSYAIENGLPTKDISSITKNGGTLTFIFDYNGQFGKYMQQLREAHAVDKRVKGFFKEMKAKEVELKSSEGDMLLSMEYDVDFILK